MSDKLATLKAKNSISFKALESGETEVSFVVDKLNYGEKTRIKTALEEAGDTLTVAVSKYRKRRSLSANAYFWELIGRLSEKLNISKEETYWEYIKHMGIYRSVEVDNKAVDTIIKMWKSHGLGWIAEKTDDGEREGFSLINLYYGSSSYNTKQMSRLIDSVVNDCKEQGIETLPPEQLECMKREWKSERFT
jgi:hypothetical protein